MRRVRLGYTMIELLVTIAIIALLIAVLIPTLSKMRNNITTAPSAGGGIIKEMKLYDSKLVLVVQGSLEKYYIEVNNEVQTPGQENQRTIFNVASALSPGMRIGFPLSRNGSTYIFSKEGFGVLRVTEIELSAATQPKHLPE